MTTTSEVACLILVSASCDCRRCRQSPGLQCVPAFSRENSASCLYASRFPRRPHRFHCRSHLSRRCSRRGLSPVSLEFLLWSRVYSSPPTSLSKSFSPTGFNPRNLCFRLYPCKSERTWLLCSSKLEKLRLHSAHAVADEGAPSAVSSRSDVPFSDIDGVSEVGSSALLSCALSSSVYSSSSGRSNTVKASAVGREV